MSDRLDARTDATADFVEVLRTVVSVGDMQWADVETDYRRLAASNALLPERPLGLVADGRSVAG
jgi:hypothetical protein